MNSLLIFKNDQTNNLFDKDEISNIVKLINGVYKINDINPDNGLSVIEACYDFNEDSTIFRLSKDLSCISMTGLGDASLNLALLLKEKIKSKLRITDFDYSFYEILNDINSLEEFHEMIANAG